MARVLTSQFLNGRVSKVLELPNDYIINGHVYDKNTFSPKPLNYCPLYAPLWESMFNKSLNIVGGWNHNRIDNGIVIDNKDSSVTYTVGGWINPSFIMYKENDGLYTANILNPCGVYSSAMDIIDQNDLKLFYFLNRDYHITYINEINKSTFTAGTSTVLGSYSQPKVIYKNASFLYIANPYTTNGFILYKYNKNDSVLTPLINDPENGFYMSSITSDAVDEDGKIKFYVVKDEFFKDNTTHRISFRRYVMDKGTENVSKLDVKINTSIYNKTIFAEIKSNSPGVGYELLNHSDGVKNYITLLVYNRGMNTKHHLGECGLYTFEIKNSIVSSIPAENKEEWTLASYKVFDPILYKGVVPMNNNNTIILTNEDGVSFYSWNKTSSSFEEASTFSMPVRQVGVDMINNVWIQTQDTSVELLANTLPVEVYADFIQDNYRFNGSPIDTEIEIYARNYNGEYLSSSLDVTLVGPVEFSVDGTKKKNITTTQTGPIKIPVTVTGQGILNVAVDIL